ncbi:AAA family ATPase [Xanthomonas bonasiae]|uniref:AAA family ATPase n=1 Tax=Xanthomonas bonasiae TaxID=2810351 RepID=UPI00177B1ACB|nr:AAA family ATPase [Xanthomonas surreyensis]MBD7921880.1 hypothetical protein [Xanthomonas surreyensis]
MKLISLQILGLGTTAWSSNKLNFGKRITQLFGPNGCGKTPIVQSIVFALGYKVEYRDDIIERCDYVILEVLVGGREFAIKRKLKGSFDVTVEERGGATAEFINEREYSRFLLSLWGLEDPVLTTVGDAATHIYSAQILPLFYLDQDHGYADEYYAAPKFIKSQYAESMRLVCKLGPKNSFDKRRAKSELKDKLEYLDRAVVRSEKLMEELTSDLGGARRPAQDIDHELQTSIDGLEALRESGGVSEQVNVELDTRIAQLQQQERTLGRERSDLEARVRGFGQIKHEIEVEADTLSLNEEARRIFASFDAICANENCGLFVRSSVTYGKSLLYLKDQIKDLERTNFAHQRRIDGISAELSALVSQISAARAARAESTTQSSVSSLVEVVSKLTEKVIKLRRARQIEGELVREETEYVVRLDERSKIQARLADLEGYASATNLDLLRIRHAICERIRFWLSVLRTPNVSLDVQMDSDFNVTFGGQKVAKFKGSTLTRIILSIRTAAFDIVTQADGTGPRFFILDTPRQQDISRDDLAEYIRKIQLLASERSAQVIFSTTNHRYDLGEDDAEWTPEFPGADHLMFLGARSNEVHDAEQSS